MLKARDQLLMYFTEAVHIWHKCSLLGVDDKVPYYMLIARDQLLMYFTEAVHIWHKCSLLGVDDNNVFRSLT